MNNERLKAELLINDLLELILALEKGNQFGVMNGGHIVKVIDYDETERTLLQMILKDNVKKLNHEIRKLSEAEPWEEV